MIKVYSKSNCPQCVAVKRWLDMHGVAYEQIDATNHIEELAELGYRQAPVTVVREGVHFYGFDVGKLQQLVSGS